MGFLTAGCPHHGPGDEPSRCAEGLAICSVSSVFQFESGGIPIVVTDIDRDGRSDIVLLHFNGGGASILMSNGDTTFRAVPDVPTADDPSADGPSAAVMADLDRDGWLDLAVVGMSTDRLMVLLGDGDGQFRASADLPIGHWPASIAAGDLDGDGYTDLIVANQGSDTVTVLRSDGGTFGAGVDYPVAPVPQDVVLGDVDRDGRLDVVVTNRDTELVSVLVGKGGGTLGSRLDSAGCLSTAVVLEDFDRNGTLDVTLGCHGPSKVAVRLGRGDGTFEPGADYFINSSVDGVWVVAADFDGNSVFDLAVEVVGGVAVLPGAGDGSFGAQVETPVEAFGGYLKAADVDGDGRPDLVGISYQVGSSYTSTVSLLLGNGDGTFRSGVARKRAADTCVNLTSDSTNCGECGHVCPKENPRCEGGSCTCRERCCEPNNWECCTKASPAREICTCVVPHCEGAFHHCMTCWPSK